MVDPQVIHAARQGDQVAWEALVRQHEQAVFRLAYLLLGDPDDAEDVAQDTFIRAHKFLHRFDVNRPLRPWLMRIASNLARNRKRAVGRYLRALERAARRDPPLTAPIDSDDSQLLWQAIRALKHSDQQVIYMRYFLELPEAEMAQALDVPAGTVKSRLHRALRKLRQIIEAEFPELRTELV